MPSSQSFDYIIIGAGSAGCVLANRLTASGRHQVLLLEAGPEDKNPWIHVPMGYARLLTDATINWLYSTEPNPDWVERRVLQPRGKVIGGSSSINGQVYMRGAAADYDHWRQLGNTGWSYEDVLPYFRKSEDQQRGADDFHGVGGPLAVSDAKDFHPLAEAYIEAAVAAGHKRNDDFNGAEQEGFGPIQWTSRNGRRCSAATGYLKPIRKRPNLTVITEAIVTQLTFDGKTATGVEYLRHDQPRTASCDGEIILAGGAFNSPQLLQLSGIGPGDLLQSLGIEVLLDRPGIGDNLQDHFTGSFIYRCKEPFTANDIANSFTTRMMAGVNYLFRRRGLLTMGAAYAGGFLYVDPNAASPDILSLLMLFSADRATGNAHPFSGFTATCAIMRPESRGTVMITSPDPHAKPAIQPNYLSAEKDRTTLIGGMRALRQVMSQSALTRYIETEFAPGSDKTSDADLLTYLKEYGRTSYHPVGTCRMGADDAAVVDPKLRVNGIDRLRVVDASIMPSLTSGNTNAPTIMIAEKASDMILEAAR